MISAKCVGRNALALRWQMQTIALAASASGYAARMRSHTLYAALRISLEKCRISNCTCFRADTTKIGVFSLVFFGLRMTLDSSRPNELEIESLTTHASRMRKHRKVSLSINCGQLSVYRSRTHGTHRNTHTHTRTLAHKKY